MKERKDQQTVRKVAVSDGNGGTKNFFQLACADAARFTSMLGFDSVDIRKPRKMQSYAQNVYEQAFYYARAGYLGAFGGFVPYWFKILPHFKLFQLWSLINTFFRRAVLSVIMRARGLGKLTHWGDQAVLHSVSDEENAKPYGDHHMAAEGRLATLDTIDPKMSEMSEVLVGKQAAIAPHSQANPNPVSALVHILSAREAFPGNFFDHLIGVWKILAAWQQPQLICRGGMVHSVYGTNQYRAGLWNYTERDQVRGLVGPGAEQLAFLICTAERSELGHALCSHMYAGGSPFTGIKALKARQAFQDFYATPCPSMTARLGDSGFTITNSVTEKKHVLHPKLFASFVIVMMADYLEQGVSSLGYFEDDDIMFFQFVKIRFWVDAVKFIAPYLDVVPPVLVHYHLLESFEEPARGQLLTLMRVWDAAVVPCRHSPAPYVQAKLSSEDTSMLVEMSAAFPWIPEPRLALAAGLGKGEAVMVGTESKTRVQLLDDAHTALRLWGMHHYKNGGHVRDALDILTCLRAGLA